MGALLAFAAALFSSVKDTFSKRLASDINPNVSTFASFAFALPFYALILAVLALLGKESFQLTAPFLIYVGLRAVTDVFAESCKMHAFSHGELSVVSSLVALTPVFLLAASPLITGDPLRPAVAIGVIITVAGNLLFFVRAASRPSRNALLFGLGAAIFMALNGCFDRLSVQHGTPVFSGFMMTLVSAILVSRMLPRSGIVRASLRANARGLITRGFFETVFMISKLWALQYLSAPEVTAFIRMSLLISVVSGRVVLDEKGFTFKILGALLMAAGTAYMLLG